MDTKKSVKKRQAKEKMLSDAPQYDGGNADEADAKVNNKAKESNMQRRSSRLVEKDELAIEGIKMLSQYHQLFDDLTQRRYVETDLDVVSMIVSYDSKYLVAACRTEHKLFEIHGYSLSTYERVFCHQFKGEYMKVNVIEQNYAGSVFVVAYQDNGKFFVSFMSQQGKIIDSLNVSEELELDALSKPVIGFDEPMITVAVFPDETVFVSVYHRIQRKQYHFMYSYLDKQIISMIDQIELDHENCTKLNFPLKSFHSLVTNDCTTFYRQGFCVTTNSDTMESRYEQITESDLGSMYLLFDEALVTRSSGNIQFFKKGLETGLWKKYAEFKNMRGQIYFIRGNIRIQVVTDTTIYYFLIDPKTFEPTLENSMNNDFNCSMLMFGRAVRYGIAYKNSQSGFRIYSRKYYHNFKVAIDAGNWEDSYGANIPSKGQYVIAHGTDLQIMDEHTFEKVQAWKVPTQSGDQEILHVAISKDDAKIAVAVGIELIKDGQEIQNIIVYKYDQKENKYLLEKNRVFDYPDACVQFSFDMTSNNNLLFFCRKELSKFNYLQDDSKKQTHYKYQSSLKHTPKFGTFSKSQKQFIVTTSDDIIFVDMSKRKEIDIDDQENVQQVESVLACNKYFYVLANKREGNLGYYLLKIEIDNPQADQREPSKYLMNWDNKMDIGNCAMHLMDEISPDGKVIQCVTVNYKAIGINTFNVFVIELESKLIRYWHESNQLWESEVMGFLLNTNDFIILSKDGINVLALGEKPSRIITDDKGAPRMIHSLGSCNYLKIDPSNHLLFACQYYDNRQVSIQEQYLDGKEEQTKFTTIYKIKVKEPTLRQLMIIQSIYQAKTQSDISKLVKGQPTPYILFDVFLELERKSMINYLAFDSKSIAALLDKKNEPYFTQEFPLFYKQRNGQSAIDDALDKNQIRSVNAMIGYLLKYQNSYVYSNLFLHNFVDLLNKGVKTSKLLGSNIFNYEFDFDQWPGTNSNINKVLRPFNQSIFDLRHQYPAIFREIWKADEHRELLKEIGDGQSFKRQSSMRENKYQINKDDKVFKIKYTLNILPSMLEDEGPIITALANCDEFDVFNCPAVIELIRFKWESFAYATQFTGWLWHLTYQIILGWYIDVVYLNMEKDPATGRYVMEANVPLLGGLAVCLLYPTYISARQMALRGSEYFREFANYVDILQIVLGYLSIVQQYQSRPADLFPKVIMIFTVATSLAKQFFYMRIYAQLSYIVTMMTNVIIDLSIFFVFFGILVFMFSLIFDVIAKNKAPEYHKISPFFGNMLTTMRLALGDFDFGILKDPDLPLNTRQHILFWVAWCVMIFMSMLIFLNFIIAEVSNSYQKVRVRINELVQRERAGLVDGIETLRTESYKKSHPEQFPKYIIVREVEE